MSVSTRIGSKARRDCLTVQTWVDSGAWVTVDDATLPEVQRELFLRRKRGIRRCLEGASAAELKNDCGLGRSHIYRLITERCLKQHPDGSLYG